MVWGTYASYRVAGGEGLLMGKYARVCGDGVADQDWGSRREGEGHGRPGEGADLQCTACD